MVVVKPLNVRTAVDQAQARSGRGLLRRTISVAIGEDCFALSSLLCLQFARQDDVFEDDNSVILFCFRYDVFSVLGLFYSPMTSGTETGSATGGSA